jgi:hypothetical protein
MAIIAMPFTITMRSLDARSGLDVAQIIKPLSEEDGSANINHGATVATRLHTVNTNCSIAFEI